MDILNFYSTYSELRTIICTYG